MKKTGIWAITITISVVAMIFFVISNISSRTVTIPFKIVVELDVDGHTRNFSTIMTNSYTPRVRGNNSNMFGIKRGGYVKTNGEAFDIDLGDRGRAFVLPRMHIKDSLSERYGWILSKQFGYRPKENYQSFYKEDLLDFAKIEGRAYLYDRSKNEPINEHLFPLIVAFEDDSDASTLYIVDPNKLEEVFGANVTLKSLYMEMTKDTLVQGKIETQLPWLKNRTKAGFPRLSRRMPDGSLRSPRSTPLQYRINFTHFYAHSQY